MTPHRPLMRWIVPGLAIALAMGCAPNSDTQQVQADQFALRGMVANDQQQIDALQEHVQRLDDRISEFEHNGSAGAGGSTQLASVQKRLDKLEAQMNSAAPTASASPAPGSSAETPTPPAAASAGGAAGAGASDEEEVPGAAPPAAMPSPTSPNAGAEAPAGAANAPSWRAMMDQELAATHDDPGAKLYRAGLLQLKANDYSAALVQLQGLQRHYPKSSLSEPAEFFAANALYEMGKYDQAILQFNDQTMRFPKGHFASAALLREAQAFIKINDRIDARLTLQKLLSDLPDSAEAPMAKSMMQTLTS